MKRIVVASTNPVKIAAAQAAFTAMFPAENFTVDGLSVPSAVAHQPLSDAETRQGAGNRAAAARQALPAADFWVGIEGGVEPQGRDMAAFAWVVVLSADRVGKARSGTFYLPRPVVDLIRQGKELGDADDIVFGRQNSKQENGAIGILTGDVINRAHLYEHAVILALVSFKNTDLYAMDSLE